MLRVPPGNVCNRYLGGEVMRADKDAVPGLKAVCYILVYQLAELLLDQMLYAHQNQTFYVMR